MKHLARWLRRLVKDTFGQDLIEYAIFIGVIAITAALSIPAVSNGIRNVFVNTQTILEAASEGRNDDSGGGEEDDGGDDDGGRNPCANPNPGNHGGRSPCAPQ